VSQTGELFLGVIAFAVMIMALIQVGAIFAGMRLAKRVDQLATQLDQEIKPLLANLTAMSSEAARAAALAARQAERLDRVFGEMVQRVDQTLAAAQQFVTGPSKPSSTPIADSGNPPAAAAPAGRSWTKKNRSSSAELRLRRWLRRDKCVKWEA